MSLKPEPDWIKRFVDHLKIDRGSSTHTIQAYASDLKQFSEGLKKNTLVGVTENDVEDFLKSLKKTEHKAASVARKVSTLKHFYKFLIQENRIENDPTLFVSSPTLEKRLPKALDSKSMLAILRVADQGLPYDGKLKAPLQKRDRAIIYLLYATGMRVTELITVPLSQVDTEASLIRVMGKRKKERIIPFAGAASEVVYQYLQQARPLFQAQSETLFIGQNGHSLTRQAVWKILKKISAEAGIPQSLHPHLFRHTFATDLLQSGIDLRSLQLLLGHADLQTTQIYTDIAPERLAEVIRRYHPRGSNEGGN